jgi:23S rRNA pseudouridine2605 synthase
MGVFLRDGITLPAEVTVVKNVIPGLTRDPGSQNNQQSMLEVTLHEGRNRQIRRMCEEVGLDLIDLERIAFGPLRLGELERGEYRALSKKEIESLKQAVSKS